MAALEGLARKEADPRARRACALPLAALCYAAKRSGGLAGGAGRDTADAGAPPAAARALQQQLSADGALRPLLESLLEGRWVLPAGEGCCVWWCH